MFSAAHLFDQQFDYNSAKEWIILLASLASKSLDTYLTIEACVLQLDNAKEDPNQDLTTVEDNAFLSKDMAKSPKVGAWETKQGVIWIVQLCLTVVGWYGAFTSGFYYFGLGVATSKFIGLVFVAIDTWADLGVIVPDSPWVDEVELAEEMEDENEDTNELDDNATELYVNWF